MTIEFSNIAHEELVKAGLSGASNIFEYQQPSGFGDSESIWELDNLRFRFTTDRGQRFIDIGSKYGKSKYFISDDLILLMGWLSFDELINLKSPLELHKILCFINNSLEEINILFSKENIKSTEKKLNEISKIKKQKLISIWS